MTEPLVDVVIPVHTDARPIARAVASVLTGTRADIRINVVCHNVRQSLIRTALGDWAADPRVRLLEFNDGVPSPAGPINHGLDLATARFTALLDSDDTYERGAIDAWLRVQARDDADAVIPMFAYADGSSTRTPPTRPFRRRRLDGARDRLAYRTRLHGLVSRSRFADLRMTPGLRTGEDVMQGATIWFSGARISFARRTPSYRIHEDSGERTSAAPKPASEALAFLDHALAPEFICGLSVSQREAFAIKLLRTHVMDVLRTAIDAGDDTDIEVTAAAVRRICDMAPRSLGILSRRDASILAELLRSSPDVSKLDAALAIRTDYRRPSNLLTGSASRILHREAPLRFLTATLLAP